jgi:hypothetical protein
VVAPFPLRARPEFLAASARASIIFKKRGGSNRNTEHLNPAAPALTREAKEDWSRLYPPLLAALDRHNGLLSTFALGCKILTDAAGRLPDIVRTCMCKSTFAGEHCYLVPNTKCLVAIDDAALDRRSEVWNAGDVCHLD